LGGGEDIKELWWLLEKGGCLKNLGYARTYDTRRVKRKRKSQDMPLLEGVRYYSNSQDVGA